MFDICVLSKFSTLALQTPDIMASLVHIDIRLDYHIPCITLELGVLFHSQSDPQYTKAVLLTHVQ